MNRTTCWLASYPKSGNTWVRAVWEAVTTGSDPDINALDNSGATAADRSAFELALGVSSSDLSPDEIELLRPRADDVVAATQESLTLRKIHDALVPGPAGEPVASVASAANAIYIVRDPRDVAISFSHYWHLPVEDVVELMLNSSATIGDPHRPRPRLVQHLTSWDEHVRSWVDAEVLEVHVVRYEDCLAGPVEAFGAVLRSVGVTVSEAEMKLAVERSGFGRLAEQEASSGFREASRSGSPFFRSGRAGQWSEALPLPQARSMERALGKTMSRFGYLD